MKERSRGWCESCGVKTHKYAHAAGLWTNHSLPTRVVFAFVVYLPALVYHCVRGTPIHVLYGENTDLIQTTEGDEA